jgi:hypothetical protein
MALFMADIGVESFMTCLSCKANQSHGKKGSSAAV